MTEKGISTEAVAEPWWEAEKRRSKRLNYLRHAAWDKACLGGNYVPGVTLGTAKVRHFTQAFQESIGEPWVIRRAKGLAATLENMPIFIVDNSQLVGYQSERPNQMLIHPEGPHLFLDDMYYDRVGYFEPEDKAWVRKNLNWWKPQSLQSQCERYLSPEDIKLTKAGINLGGQMYLDGVGSSNTDWEFLFKHGISGIIEMVEEKIEDAESRLWGGPGTPDTLDLIPMIDEWNAMKISAVALVNWAKRYSRLAKVVAENFEADPKRKSELMEIARVCDKVPENPPEHLNEAMQFEHIYGQATKYIETVEAGYGIRFDQVYWPYYKKDVIDDKKMTHEEVLDLLGEWQIRKWESNYATTRVQRSYVPGTIASLPTITIGGVKPEDGQDACNDLTDSLLEAARLTRIGNPTYVFAWHPNARMQTIKQVFECIRQGLGYPSIQHDAVCTDTLMYNYGATLEEARCWANVVCMSPGLTKGRGGTAVRYPNAHIIGNKSVELTLFNGKDVNVTGLQIGPETGDATKFETFEEFWEAWRKQLACSLESSARSRNICRKVESMVLQAPLQSCCWSRCIDNGMDCKDARCEELGTPWFTVVAWPDTGDSIYAVKKLVFDEKKYTMEQMMEALRANWEGYEEMRMECVRLPKWGNDIEDVDKLNADTYHALSELSALNREWSGSKFMPLPEQGGGHVVLASRIGPLPNGRVYPDSLYDGGCSPGAGMDKKGPTAVLRSVSKIDGRRMKENLLNQRLSPSQLAGEKGFQLWMNYMKTWYELQIPHVQFNCVDSETLRAAQMQPEKYSELIVRVAGFSAIFVDQNRMTQDSIIARAVQEV